MPKLDDKDFIDGKSLEFSPPKAPVPVREEIDRILSCSARVMWVDKDSKESILRMLTGYVENITSQAITETRKEDKKLVRRGVYMMRQWLNENRIKDTKRFVTNEDLLSWFDSLEDKDSGGKDD